MDINRGSVNVFILGTLGKDINRGSVIFLYWNTRYGHK